MKRLVSLAVIILFIAQCGVSAAMNASFQRGVELYRDGEFAGAAKEFRAAVGFLLPVPPATAGSQTEERVRGEVGTGERAKFNRPASGALLNLGLTEWRRGRVGPAVLAWEQARWVDPFDARARENLRYARQLTGVEPPELMWYERASGWLPANAWAWLVSVSFWLALGLTVLPGVFRWHKAAWTQALAALSLAVFLAGLPAYFGSMTRTLIGFTLEKNTLLRLTPTEEGEVVAKLSSGEPGRVLRSRRNYVLVRTARGEGWLEQNQFGLVCPR